MRLIAETRLGSRCAFGGLGRLGNRLLEGDRDLFAPATHDDEGAERRRVPGCPYLDFGGTLAGPRDRKWQGFEVRAVAGDPRIARAGEAFSEVLLGLQRIAELHFDEAELGGGAWRGRHLVRLLQQWIGANVLSGPANSRISASAWAAAEVIAVSSFPCRAGAAGALFAARVAVPDGSGSKSTRSSIDFPADAVKVLARLPWAVLRSTTSWRPASTGVRDASGVVPMREPSSRTSAPATFEASETNATLRDNRPISARASDPCSGAASRASRKNRSSAKIASACFPSPRYANAML
jgi:hypothetical protein